MGSETNIEKAENTNENNTANIEDPIQWEVMSR